MKITVIMMIMGHYYNDNIGAFFASFALVLSNAETFYFEKVLKRLELFDSYKMTKTNTGVEIE